MKAIQDWTGWDFAKRKQLSAITCLEETKTVQSSKDEADINTIVKRFGITGQMPQALVPPSFDDYENVFDFQSAQNALIDADRSFMQLPADIRGRFQNSPQAFLEFCSKAENLPELRKLGLAVPEVVIEEPAPIAVRVVAEPAPA